MDGGLPLVGCQQNQNHVLLLRQRLECLTDEDTWARSLGHLRLGDLAAFLLATQWFLGRRRGATFNDQCTAPRSKARRASRMPHSGVSHGFRSAQRSCK